MRPSASALWSLPARLAGYLVGRLMPFYGPQAGQKRAMAASKGREEGKGGGNRLNRRQKGRENHLGWGSCLVAGFGLVGIIDWNWMKLQEWRI